MRYWIGIFYDYRKGSFLLFNEIQKQQPRKQRKTRYEIIVHLHSVFISMMQYKLCQNQNVNSKSTAYLKVWQSINSFLQRIEVFRTNQLIYSLQDNLRFNIQNVTLSAVAEF